MIKVLSAKLCLVLFVPFCGYFFFQSQDLFRQHYEAANAAHRAGRYDVAEAEFKVILGEAYERLGKIYSAQGNYAASVSAFEAGNAARTNSNAALIDLSIAYFHLGQFSKAIEALQRVIDPGNPSVHHMRLHFGLEKRTKVDQIQVRWPSGTIDKLTGIGVDKIITIKEGQGKLDEKDFSK